jgi:hypothetical protein
MDRGRYRACYDAQLSRRGRKYAKPLVLVSAMETAVHAGPRGIKEKETAADLCILGDAILILNDLPSELRNYFRRQSYRDHDTRVPVPRFFFSPFSLG